MPEDLKSYAAVGGPCDGQILGVLPVSTTVEACGTTYVISEAAGVLFWRPSDWTVEQAIEHLLGRNVYWTTTRPRRG